MVGSSPTPTFGVRAMASQIATLATVTEAPTIATEVLAPTIVTETDFTLVMSSFASVPTIGKSSVEPGSWLTRPSPRGDYLLGGVLPVDLEYMRKNLSLAVVHRDMMHYIAKVKCLLPLCFFFYYFLVSFPFLCTDLTLFL